MSSSTTAFAARAKAMTITLTKADTRTLFVLMSGLKSEYTGADIMRLGRFWLIGSVYPSLAKIERAGWVTSRWENSEYPRRRFYLLTEFGRAAAAEVILEAKF